MPISVTTDSEFELWQLSCLLSAKTGTLRTSDGKRIVTGPALALSITPIDRAGDVFDFEIALRASYQGERYSEFPGTLATGYFALSTSNARAIASGARSGGRPVDIPVASGETVLLYCDDELDYESCLSDILHRAEVQRDVPEHEAVTNNPEFWELHDAMLRVEPLSDERCRISVLYRDSDRNRDVSTLALNCDAAEGIELARFLLHCIDR